MWRPCSSRNQRLPGGDARGRLVSGAADRGAERTRHTTRGRIAINRFPRADLVTSPLLMSLRGMDMHVNRAAPRGRRCCVEPLETRLHLTAGELIVNGGFETGATGWTASGSWQAGLNNTSFTTYHGGSRYAFYGNASNGSTVNNSSGSLFQEIAIPAGYGAPTLTFWSRTSTSETTTSARNDTMVVTVQPAGGGTPIQTL